MYESRARLRFTAVAVIAVGLSIIRVQTDPSSAEPIPHYTVRTALDEVRTDVHATVVGLRREKARWEAHLDRMRADTYVLQERLAGR